jgi:hypothetical protein
MLNVRRTLHVGPLAVVMLTAPAVAHAHDALRVPAGTVIPVRFETTVSSATSHAEDRVDAVVRNDVRVRGAVAIPAGSELRGHVVTARRAGKIKGRAYLSVQFDRLVVRGRTYDIATRRLGVEAPSGTGRDAKTIGGGAGAGAIVGAIADGKSGALKGALIGGAAGTGVVLATRGKEVTLPAGTRWRVRLVRPLALE